MCSGGSAIATTVNSGGTEYISSGGSAISTTLALGGAIDLAYLFFVSGGSAVLSGQTLTVTEGGISKQLQLAGSYTGEIFQVANDYAGDTLITAIAPPSITGMIGGDLTGNTATIWPFSTVTITDPNSGQTETVTVTVSAPANGTLSNFGGGSYNPTTGVYTTSGSAAQVSAALDSLVFNPTIGGPGQSVTTSFTLAVTDTAGATATFSTTSTIVDAERNAVLSLAANVFLGLIGGTGYTVIGSSDTIASTSNTSFNLVGGNDTVELAANDYLGLIGGAGYTVTGTSFTIATTSNTSFNLVGGNDTVELAANDYLGLIGGSGYTVTGTSFTIATTSRYEFQSGWRQ